jgi:hypothetical protein
MILVEENGIEVMYVEMSAPNLTIIKRWIRRTRMKEGANLKEKKTI